MPLLLASRIPIKKRRGKSCKRDKGACKHCGNWGQYRVKAALLCHRNACIMKHNAEQAADAVQAMAHAVMHKDLAGVINSGKALEDGGAVKTASWRVAERKRLAEEKKGKLE